VADSIEDTLRRFFTDELNLRPIGDYEKLSASGYVVSENLLELIDYIEQHFAVVLEEGDITPAKLATISAIAATVRRRLAA
jgi:hypothetical protein